MKKRHLKGHIKIRQLMNAKNWWRELVSNAKEKLTHFKEGGVDTVRKMRIQWKKNGNKGCNKEMWKLIYNREIYGFVLEDGVEDIRESYGRVYYGVKMGVDRWKKRVNEDWRKRISKNFREKKKIFLREETVSKKVRRKYDEQIMIKLRWEVWRFQK